MEKKVVYSLDIPSLSAEKVIRSIVRGLPMAIRYKTDPDTARKMGIPEKGRRRISWEFVRAPRDGVVPMRGIMEGGFRVSCYLDRRTRTAVLKASPNIH